MTWPYTRAIKPTNKNVRQLVKLEADYDTNDLRSQHYFQARKTDHRQWMCFSFISLLNFGQFIIFYKAISEFF